MAGIAKKEESSGAGAAAKKTKPGSMPVAGTIWQAMKTAIVIAGADKDPTVQLRQKKLLCIRISGFREAQMEELHRWTDAKNPTSAGTMQKPQWLHSAASVQMLLRYPHMRPPRSFSDCIVEEGFAKEYLDASADVMRSDPDGAYMYEHMDRLIGGSVIVDDHNKLVTTVDEENATSVTVAVTTKPAAVAGAGAGAGSGI